MLIKSNLQSPQHPNQERKRSSNILQRQRNPNSKRQGSIGRINDKKTPKNIKPTRHRNFYK